MTDIIESWIQEGNRDNPVWLSDVRRICAKSPDTEPVVLRLALWDRTSREWKICLPLWRTPEQEQFVQEYLCATVFNILAAFSGSCLQIFCNQANEAVSSLVSRLPDLFQVEKAVRNGYGKPVTVANRIGSSLGQGTFSFQIQPMGAYVPLQAPSESVPDGNLAERLRGATARCHGLSGGLDVGGTDVKLTLALDGNLLLTKVMDWNPSQSPTAEGIIQPIVSFLRQALDSMGPGRLLDSLGISFPDVVIRDKVVGGETPKTKGMRLHYGKEYDREFQPLRELKQSFAALCAPGALVHIINDGSMAAFTAAVELACADKDELIRSGVIAHTLGTDLGTGWITQDGRIPEIPLEIYDLLVDLGSRPSRSLPPDDIRSVRNVNSGLPGARRYIGQDAAYRLACMLCPELLDGYVTHRGDVLTIRTEPDMRKPCLECLMSAATHGWPGAPQVFRQIGYNLGQICQEMSWLLHPKAKSRFIFGRFITQRQCFSYLREGFTLICPELELVQPEHMAYSPLMKQLARKMHAVARYAQAVGAIYFPYTVE